MPAWKKQPGVGSHTYHWNKHIRPAALQRDNHRCTWIDAGQRCTNKATEVDRHIPRSQGGTETLDNARSLCKPHHQTKSSSEGGRAKRRRNRYTINRTPEPHPAYRKPHPQ